VLQWNEGHAYDEGDRQSAINRTEFYNALITVAASRSGNVVSDERLGRWLKQMKQKSSAVSALYALEAETDIRFGS
jgi:hypothetical protein